MISSIWCSTLTLLRPFARHLVGKMIIPNCSLAHHDMHNPVMKGLFLEGLSTIWPPICLSKGLLWIINRWAIMELSFWCQSCCQFRFHFFDEGKPFATFWFQETFATSTDQTSKWPINYLDLFVRCLEKVPTNIFANGGLIVIYHGSKNNPTQILDYKATKGFWTR